MSEDTKNEIETGTIVVGKDTENEDFSSAQYRYIGKSVNGRHLVELVGTYPEAIYFSYVEKYKRPVELISFVSNLHDTNSVIRLDWSNGRRHQVNSKSNNPIDISAMLRNAADLIRVEQIQGEL